LSSVKLISLKTFFRKEAIKWSLVGLVLILVFAFPGFIWVLKTASEKQIQTMTQSAALAFRPIIIAGVREAQLQMTTALKLKEGETVVVRDKDLNVIYNDGNEPPRLACKPNVAVCWRDHFSKIERLEPIYNDVDQQEIYGYVDLTMKPVFDRTWLLAFLALIPLIFIIQFLGLVSASDGSSDALILKLKQWTKHLRESANKTFNPLSAPPFLELADMQGAVEGLHNQIKNLETKAAKDATDSAQLAIIREIGHDLKTPLSQLAKYWALHLDTVRSTNEVNEKEVKNVERILSRMGGIIRQIRAARQLEKRTEIPRVSTLQATTEKIIDDLKIAFDISGDKLKFDCQSNGTAMAFVTPTEYYQIVENLVRNSLDALPNGTGKVSVCLDEEEGRPCLRVIDDGVGIPEKYQSKIFDYDFSQKLSKGTGLGLGIVKRICNAYQADLSFKSQVGQGTEFKIKFQVFDEREVFNAVQSINC
jgi:signal transduction histidine kinase